MNDKKEKITIDLEQSYTQTENEGAACSPEFGCILPNSISEEE